MRLAHISAKFWLIASLALCCGTVRPVQAQAHSATTPAPATKPATHSTHPSSAAKPQASARPLAKSQPKPQAKANTLAMAKAPQHPKAATPTKPQNSAKAAKRTKTTKAAPALKQKKAPAKAPVASAPAPPAAPVAQAQPAAPAEPIENKRDPFLPLLRPKGTGGGTEHLPPGKAGLVVSTVRIDGTVEEQNQMIAVVSNPEDKVYFIREGDRLYDGEVEKIDLDGVTFKETSKDAFGKPVERTVTKRIYASAGEAQ